MTSDENETKPSISSPRAGAGNASRWLALVPVTAAALVFLLMVPRGTPAEDIPLPAIDGRALHTVEADDDDRAGLARRERLSTAVLAVGSAMRDLNKSMGDRDDDSVGIMRRKLDDALRGAKEVEGDGVLEKLKTLRAVQLDEFLAEVRRFEETGTRSKELEELGGGFVERMSDAGWIEGHHVLLTDDERRVAFKLVWTALVFLDRDASMALTIDEQRALYTLYFQHPHVPDSQRVSYQLMRRGAASADECHTVAVKERIASELWRAEKIRRLGEIDPTYPTGYALGVSYYRAGRFDEAMEAFRTWMDTHPDGPLSSRARNHWKAAYVAAGPLG